MKQLVNDMFRSPY